MLSLCGTPAACGTKLELLNELRFQISNYELRQRASLHDIDDITSTRGESLGATEWPSRGATETRDLQVDVFPAKPCGKDPRKRHRGDALPSRTATASLGYAQVQAPPDFGQRNRFGALPTNLDHLPETRVPHREDVLELFALDADNQRRWPAVPGDQHPIPLGFRDVAAQRCFGLSKRNVPWGEAGKPAIGASREIVHYFEVASRTYPIAVARRRFGHARRVGVQDG